MKYQLSVNQTDKEVLDTFCEIIGIGKVRGPYGPYKGQLNKKPIFIWKVVGEEATTVSHQLLPYLLAKGQQVSAKLRIYEEGRNGPIHAT